MNASRQGGWALVVILIALAIVAFLSRDALTRYLGAARSGPTDASARPAGAVPAEPAGATPVLAAPVERARAVEDAVGRQAADLARKIDREAR
jgi:hypothetical protein